MNRFPTLSDRRGAIMVTAAFMAIFVCGALWYVIGVGDAILYRERVQDAADAVAFAGAVYHARGMNIIVTLNIVMAALLGLVVAAKLLKFLNDTANVIGCGCIPVPFIGAACSAVCSTTRAARQPINTTVDRLTQLYNKVGPILSKTQNGVAIAMPWLAEAKSVMVSLKYQPDVRFGAMASVSLVPLGGRKGLPVEDGDDDVLCGKVSSGIVDLVFDTLHLPGIVRGWIGGTLESFVSNFCDGGELVDPKKQEEIQNKEENEHVDKRCDWEQEVSHALDDPFSPFSGPIIEKARADHGNGNVDLTKLQCYPLQKDGQLANLPDNHSSTSSDDSNAPVEIESSTATPPGAYAPCPFNRLLCEQRAHADIKKRRADEQAKSGPSSGGTQAIDGAAREESRPKVVYHDAKNGNAYFQVWSLVLGDDSRATRPARGVEVAALGHRKAKDPSLWAKLGWAQAEFYYDTDRAWDEDVAKYDAMWNLRWRARLRRVNPTNVPDYLSESMGDVVGKLEDKVVEMISGDDDGGHDDSVSSFVDTLVGLGFDKAAEPLQDLSEDGDTAIEDGVHTQWNRFGGIH